MKLSTKPEKLKLLILGAGLLGGLLRALLYATGTDEKGLLVPGHWAGIALWILTAAVGVILALTLRKIPNPDACGDACPASVLSAGGSFLAAVGFLVSGLSGWGRTASSMDSAVGGLSLLSAAALGYVGFCRLTRKKPIFLCHAAVCVCFALRMVCQYRSWSSDPQLQDYCFHMTAHVCLMLASYHMAAFDSGAGRRKTLWFLGCAGAYLCLVSLWGNREPLFMVLCGIWLLTALPELKPEDEPREGA